MINPNDRKPTDDERDGMNWWNGLSEVARGEWLARAGTARAADAWAAYKDSHEQR